MDVRSLNFLRTSKNMFGMHEKFYVSVLFV